MIPAVKITTPMTMKSIGSPAIPSSSGLVPDRSGRRSDQILTPTPALSYQS